MGRLRRAVLAHGAIGGLVAGGVVALWFLGVDLAAGEPFRTPARLAVSLAGGEGIGRGAGPVALYSLLHFGVFAVLGVAAAAFLERTGQAPGILAGVVFGVGVLDVVLYSATLLTGGEVVEALPTTQVLAANLVAGVAYMLYLNRAAWGEHPVGLEVLDPYPGFRRGLVAGVVGAAAVAVWFFALDLMAGRPYHTPAALGSALFLGAASPEEVRTSLGVVAAYSVVHLSAFVIVGLLFEWVASTVERTPALWIVFALGFIVMEAVFVPTAGLAGVWVMRELSWWAVGIGNLVSVAVMGWWIWRAHPALRRAVSQRESTAAG